MWYILETEGNAAGSTRLGSAQILGVGGTLLAAQVQAVRGFLDGTAELALSVPIDAVDFAYVVQYCGSAGRTLIALEVQANGALNPHNR